MTINCREWSKLPDHGQSLRRRVFVNGTEIHKVWYLDTDAGLVKTYDVYGDGQAHSSRPTELPLPQHVEDSDGVLSKTIRGAIELKPL